jgi:hypothetical protein
MMVPHVLGRDFCLFVPIGIWILWAGTYG